MFGIVTGLIIAASGVSAFSMTHAEAVNALPPRPSPEAIRCRDKGWRDSNLQSVEGAFQLDKKLQPFVSQALHDARQAGYTLQLTSTYRSCDEQRQLRIAACGTGDYNLYVKPIDLCLPPTEPAGKSLHNEGLAIDFKCGGYGFFESSPCYAWLQQNGYRYHLYEHRLEPWHWSTTGH